MKIVDKEFMTLIPICTNCKKIRDDKSYWNEIEAYIQKYSDATFRNWKIAGAFY